MDRCRSAHAARSPGLLCCRGGMKPAGPCPAMPPMSHVQLVQRGSESWHTARSAPPGGRWWPAPMGKLSISCDDGNRGSRCVVSHLLCSVSPFVATLARTRTRFPHALRPWQLEVAASGPVLGAWVRAQDTLACPAVCRFVARVICCCLSLTHPKRWWDRHDKH